MAWSKRQRNVVIAAYLGWTLDAFDFFLVVFVLKDIAVEFHSEVKEVAFAILLTLALRPVGAFVFGLLLITEVVLILVFGVVVVGSSLPFPGRGRQKV